MFWLTVPTVPIFCKSGHWLLSYKHLKLILIEIFATFVGTPEESAATIVGAPECVLSKILKPLWRGGMQISQQPVARFTTYWYRWNREPKHFHIMHK